ncbi:zinc-dependent alcohol dehydrogenase family protein [Solimonas flava]|uniref:zinc-dependent alcohol dehydrogenase family protein n=1 Tax=Solimonas flava TaxID=415849 RepID=UPI00048948A4
MRAAVADAVDAPLRVRSVPRPSAGPGQVLVRVAASGLNPLDLKIHAGIAAHARQPLPAILGIDLAGTVAALGAGVTRFAVGDPVYGMAGGVGGLQGTLAEYAAVDARLLARAPANLSLRDAATLPLVVITAWEGLVDRARVHAGQRVLVLGGSGGVGQAAIQLARAFGAEVVATAGESRRARIEALGARFVDARSAALPEALAQAGDGHGYDLVYDTAGGASLDLGFATVKRFGHVVSSLGWGTHALAPLSFRAATYSGVFTLLPLLSGEGRAHHGEILDAAARRVEAGQLTPAVAAPRYTLDTVNEAYAALREGRAQGKLVVDVAP